MWHIIRHICAHQDAAGRLDSGSLEELQLQMSDLCVFVAFSLFETIWVKAWSGRVRTVPISLTNSYRSGALVANSLKQYVHIEQLVYIATRGERLRRR